MHLAKVCSFYFYRFFSQFDCYCFRATKIAHRTKGKYHLDALFLNQGYRGSKFCPPVLDTCGLRDPFRYIRDYSMFNVC
jgi:hypothetical protein